MIHRREFIGAVGATIAATAFSRAQARPRKRVAIVTTEWAYRSHAWHGTVCIGLRAGDPLHQCVTKIACKFGHPSL